MNPQQAPDPLANLHPLRQPAEIAWWPPAPGWWLLLALVLLLVLGLCWLTWRRHRARRYRREAAARLDALHSAHRADPATPFAAPCNQLLKAVALRSFPANEVAGLHGRAWLDFLNDTFNNTLNNTAPASIGRGRVHFPDTFPDQLYRKNNEAEDIDLLYRAARRWILHHGSRR